MKVRQIFDEKKNVAPGIGRIAPQKESLQLPIPVCFLGAFAVSLLEGYV